MHPKNSPNPQPDHTAVRVALWRALHLEADAKPAILVDDLGAKLVAEPDWRQRPDMNLDFSKPMRASIVGRARFIEDLVEEHIKQGVSQYVILGAGLDTFAQRRPELASKLDVFEIDRPDPQTWKQKRLKELGFSIPGNLHFVPVDFESEKSWWDSLLASGFRLQEPAVVVSTGVSMYLSKEANAATLRLVTGLAQDSVFAMTFLLALDLLDTKERASMEFVMKRAQESGTPFLSLFSPQELLKLAREAGFRSPEYVSATDLYERYFVNRTDGLRAGNTEAVLVAKTS